jgi:hypothetical protein
MYAKIILSTTAFNRRFKTRYIGSGFFPLRETAHRHGTAQALVPDFRLALSSACATPIKTDQRRLADLLASQGTLTASMANDSHSFSLHTLAFPVAAMVYSQTFLSSLSFLPYFFLLTTRQRTRYTVPHKNQDTYQSKQQHRISVCCSDTSSRRISSFGVCSALWSRLLHPACMQQATWTDGIARV